MARKDLNCLMKERMFALWVFLVAWLAVLAVIILLGTFFGGCGNGQAGQDNSSVPSPKPAPVASPGHNLFQNNCAPCHGVDGNTPNPGIQPAPKRLGSEYVQKKSDQELKNVISKGKPDSPFMIPRPSLSDKDLKELVKHIRSLDKVK